VIDYEGILVVDKPYGWTSHDVVKKTRNMLNAKVGHTGTLDPMATGILILLVGKATRYASFMTNHKKRYLAEVLFGFSTDTYDAMGNKVETGDPEFVDKKKLRSLLNSFKGEMYQVPPMWSAKKIGGKRLYDLARAGKTVEREPAKIVIFNLSYNLAEFPSIRLDLTCSSGTYVRSIANDIGEKAGCPSHLKSLKRIESGPYTISNAIDFLKIVNNGNTEELKSYLLPLDLPGVNRV
jgi:tRNA pseudouridine55 synthase